MTFFDRFSLDGRAALVTGGGRGLGLEIARPHSKASIGRDLLDHAWKDATAFKVAPSRNERSGRFIYRTAGKNANPCQHGKIWLFLCKIIAICMSDPRRRQTAHRPLAITRLLNLHLRDRNNAGEYPSLRRKTFLTLCAGLCGFAIFLTIANHFTGKRADFANPTGVSEQQWQGQIDDLRVNRRALASAIGTCERSVDDRLSDGRILQSNIEQLALKLGVPSGQAIRVFCGRFFETVLDQKMSLKDYTRAMAIQPSEVLQTLPRP